jgi:hypothetical protein
MALEFLGIHRRVREPRAHRDALRVVRYGKPRSASTETGEADAIQRVVRSRHPRGAPKIEWPCGVCS